MTPFNQALAGAPVRIDSGLVEGAPAAAGIRAFLGIPFAAPPLGVLRWREPQPVAPWTGTRPAQDFGPRPMQGSLFADMIFRDRGPAEDCLYLNVWTPATSASAGLPVMVWIYGGGFQAGAASEPRQDGSALAKKGVVIVSCNYRLGVFGFLAHPELTSESGHGASGNYGLLDQIAALRWVQRNIAAFGGDPGNVTIFGESAGSASVCALMTSPLARGLFQKAIGESGALFGTGGRLENSSLAAGERTGLKLQQALGARSLAELRSRPAAAVLKAALGDRSLGTGPVLDGWVLPKDPVAAWEQGQASQVPLLAGWNADEVRVYSTFGDKRPTARSFAAEVRAKYGPRADAVLRLYPAGTDAEAVRSAGDLADDQFIVFSTWKWVELQLKTGREPAYRYSFDRDIPVPPGKIVNGAPATGEDTGAVHAGEIVYVFGTLASSPGVTWQPEDQKLSETMGSYWTNFAKTGNPNGDGLPTWPQFGPDDGYQVMHLSTVALAAPETHRDRYEFWDSESAKGTP